MYLFRIFREFGVACLSNNCVLLAVSLECITLKDEDHLNLLFILPTI